MGAQPTSKDFEHLRSEFPEKERRQLRSVGSVPREILIPAKAVANDFVREVIMSELTRLFPVCAGVGIKVDIDTDCEFPATLSGRLTSHSFANFANGRPRERYKVPPSLIRTKYAAHSIDSDA